MRFLVDRCAGGRLAEWLGSQGHDVVEARLLGPDPGDETLIAWAETQSRILVTIDTDFGKLVYLDRARHAGIVRLPDVPAAARIRLMRQVIAGHTPALESGAVVTVRGGRIRVSGNDPGL